MINDEWLTPPEILQALGSFDLDPCSPINRPWDTAKKHLTIQDNGLLHPWEGRVWLNPPYGREASFWLEKMCFHNNGIALIFARTETEMFFKYVWNMATALLFIKNRITFYTVNGNPGRNNGGAPSVLIAYGDDNAECLRHCTIPGKFIMLKNVKR